MMRKAIGVFLLLLLVFITQESVPVAEARMCQSQSHGYRGPCFRNHNCALVCRNEGFSGGRCRGFRHRCFCTRLC
ncbi:hypothetical protein M9H77_10104 [Catharanthus roseus]|uniref:Uncharacterized protein n=1 Tax=Catharanthus roseus TaxID=4058 RepID=A0ACC0C2U8_CATRO|nr:hypothetical protein M9H77_10104 [Catharanthus roseus]